jgi:hypothetical protein
MAAVLDTFGDNVQAEAAGPDDSERFAGFRENLSG